MTRQPFPWEQADDAAPAVATGAEEIAELAPPPHAAPATVGYVQEAVAGIDLAPAIAAAEKAARDALQAQLAGRAIELSTSSVSGQRIRLTDAKNRAMRTLLQNLGVDFLVAMSTLIPSWFGLDFSTRAAWSIVGLSVIKTVVLTLLSYVSRLAVTPVIPTPFETTGGAVVQPVPPKPSSDAQS